MLVVGLYAAFQDQFYLLSANVSEKIIVRVGRNLHCFHARSIYCFDIHGRLCVCVILGHKNDHRLKKIEEKSDSRILYEYVVIF